MPSKETFIDFLADLDDGELLPRLTQEQQQVVRGVRRTGLAGKIVLEIVFKADGRTVVAKPKVKTTIPTAANNSTAFYDNEEGELSRSDPKQLPLRNVTVRPASKLRVAGQDKDDDDKGGN